MSAAPTLFQFGDLRIDPDERVELTFSGLRQRLWFRGDFNPALATNVTGGNLTALIPLDRGQRVALGEVRNQESKADDAEQQQRKR